MADVARRSWTARVAVITVGVAAVGTGLLPALPTAANATGTAAGAPGTANAGASRPGHPANTGRGHAAGSGPGHGASSKATKTARGGKAHRTARGGSHKAAHAGGSGRDSGRRHEVTYFYGDAAQNIFDAYWHDSTQAQPGILILHGGYWVAGDKHTWQHTARWFADRGYAVFAANYRLAQQAPWPAQRADALDAIAYIKRHAAEFDLDPDRLAVFGSSAGGQIAADVGTYGTASKRIRGVVALSPVAAPYQAYLDGDAPGATKKRKKLRRTAAKLAGCRPGPSAACWSTWYSMTPKNHAGPGDVPMFIAFSQGDLVSSTEGVGLRDALREHGVHARLTVLPGAYHAGALLHLPGMYHRILRFLDHVTRPEEPGEMVRKKATATPSPSRTRTATPTPTRTPPGTSTRTGSPVPTRPTTPPTPTLPTPSIEVLGR